MRDKKQTCHLIIFVRNPEIGKIKTRLARDVGKDKALSIYIQLLKKIWQTTEGLNVEKTIYYAEAPHKNDLWNKGGFKKAQQIGNDIGERMAQAIFQAFEAGYKKVCLIGSDIYNLDRIILTTAFDHLENKDMVIGPAFDGGYYLIGMKGFEPFIFKNKKWSSSTVFRDTLTDIKKGGLSFALLPELMDIDTSEDLKRIQDLI